MRGLPDRRLSERDRRQPLLVSIGGVLAALADRAFGLLTSGLDEFGAAGPAEGATKTK